MKTIFFADTSNNLGSGIAVIALALAGAGPLALAWSFVAGQLLTAIILLIRAPAVHWPGWTAARASGCSRSACRWWPPTSCSSPPRTSTT